ILDQVAVLGSCPHSPPRVELPHELTNLERRSRRKFDEIATTYAPREWRNGCELSNADFAIDALANVVSQSMKIGAFHHVAIATCAMAVVAKDDEKKLSDIFGIDLSAQAFSVSPDKGKTLPHNGTYVWEKGMTFFVDDR